MDRDTDPFADFACEKIGVDVAIGIDSAPGDVTVIGEPEVDGAYIASSLTFEDYGIPTR